MGSGNITFSILSPLLCRVSCSTYHTPCLPNVLLLRVVLGVEQHWQQAMSESYCLWDTSDIFDPRCMPETYAQGDGMWLVLSLPVFPPESSTLNNIHCLWTLDAMATGDG